MHTFVNIQVHVQNNHLLNTYTRTVDLLIVFNICFYRKPELFFWLTNYFGHKRN